ncbi:MAG TPA: ATP-binding protein [Gemmatimonadaceae bacterium]|jgi:serine/threonine-protein kinase RsbW|nr:ATP-binding protein [Gemmatimonadaceae bacterium]
MIPGGDSGDRRDTDRVAPTRVAFDRLIPSDVREIEPIVEQVTRHCRELELSPRQCALNVPVALTEALSNAILRGNRGNRDKHVRVRAMVSDSALVLEVADEGAGFDLEACTVDSTSPENIEREDGRGLFLMRSLMDRVERFDADARNVVRLTLRLP